MTMSARNLADKPTYVYKLVPFSPSSPIPLDPTALPDALPVSPIDHSSGFIHLSTAHQVLGTLVRFFVSEPKVYLLRLPYTPLEQRGVVRWETPEGDVCGPRPGEGLFPHVYNGLRVGREEVDGMWVLERGEGWEGAMKDSEFEAWFVY